MARHPSSGRTARDFWKVVVAVDAEDRLFATACVVSQQSVLDMTRLDEAAIAVSFGTARTSLRTVDPLARELAKPVWKRRRRAPGPTAPQESALVATPIDPDAPLSGYGDIVLGSD